MAEHLQDRNVLFTPYKPGSTRDLGSWPCARIAPGIRVVVSVHRGRVRAIYAVKGFTSVGKDSNGIERVDFVPGERGLSADNWRRLIRIINEDRDERRMHGTPRRADAPEKTRWVGIGWSAWVHDGKIIMSGQGREPIVLCDADDEAERDRLDAQETKDFEVPEDER